MRGDDTDATGRLKNQIRGLLPGGLLLRPTLLPPETGQPTAGLPAEGRGERSGAVKDAKRPKAYQELRTAMLKSLKDRGLDSKAYTDKVDEYMDFWTRRRELRDDVSERGLTVMDERGRITENRSVSLEVQVSRQMLAIFTTLGFKPDDIRPAAEDDDDL